VIVRNQLFQGDRKEGCLGPAFALHIAHKKYALAFTKASSHLFSDGQQSFVTICIGEPFLFARQQIAIRASQEKIIPA
jgi:hypothetical protein